MSDFYSLKIKSVEELTLESVAVSFVIPAELKSKFNFYSGQYVTLETKINGNNTRRSYSICSAPNEDITVGIKKLQGGIFSSHAVDNFKKGEAINVSTPEGRFYYKENYGKEIITGIAAGSGITPILSIAKSVVRANKENKFVLIYGNKSKSDKMFSTELLKLKSEFPDRFIIIDVYSRASEEGCFFGRIDNSIINYCFKKYGKADKYFICGPEEMIKKSSDKLLSSGISKKNIFFELFVSKNTKSSELTEDIESTIDIVYEGVNHTIKNPKSKTILDSALDSNIDVPYSCQGGVCSACIAKIIKGKVTMDNNQILTDQEIDDGLILVCQSKSTDSYLKINFDDV